MVGKKAIAALCAAGAFAAGCDMSDEYLGGGEATASPVERPVVGAKPWGWKSRFTGC